MKYLLIHWSGKVKIFLAFHYWVTQWLVKQQISCFYFTRNLYLILCNISINLLVFSCEIEGWKWRGSARVHIWNPNSIQQLEEEGTRLSTSECFTASLSISIFSEGAIRQVNTRYITYNIKTLKNIATHHRRVMLMKCKIIEKHWPSLWNYDE